ncbi:L,D-transpeptidase family protein [Desmospora profundinema]|uniref:SH3-like domain-containing protein n=1 Tax=Desmospora profundinema TaxID=1571184 RepID=A0ABU1IRF4_9BACL|nr:L,D-transpeptidase family protein [Desmospora profundinema]MDR6227368.1 SH3-like domain-containing protein [Desmospora profundinema]
MRKWLTSLLSLALVFSLALPQQVDASSNYAIEVNKKTNQLTLYRNGTVAKTYPVATGRTSSLTPEGTFEIIIKINKPGWKGIPGGDPSNPLGERWLGLQVNGDNGRTYGIHGTNRPESIGSHASMGCVRMYNEDVIELYNTVPAGTLVRIHNGDQSGPPQPKPPQVTPADGKVEITVSVANVRSQPSMNGTVVAKRNKGTRLTLTGIAGDWYRVKLENGSTAYVHHSVAKRVTGSGQQPPSGSQLTVTSSMANIREQPSTQARILQRVPQGTVLNRTGSTGDWHQIKLKSGQTAYIHKSVVQ